MQAAKEGRPRSIPSTEKAMSHPVLSTLVVGAFASALASLSAVPASAEDFTPAQKKIQAERRLEGRVVGADGHGVPHASVWVGGICTDRGAPIVITRVEPVRAMGGLRVVDFVVTPPNSVKVGFTAKKSLSALYPDFTSHEVRLPCSDDADDPTFGAQREDLNLEISKPGSAPASAQRFRVFYEADGDEESVDVLFSIYICKRNLDSHACKAFSHTL